MKTIKITNDEYDYLYSALTLNIIHLDSMLKEARNEKGKKFLSENIEDLKKLQDKLRQAL